MKGIRLLAQQLDISTGTVSRALNGKADVNEETRKRVLAAAAALGYVPNQSGRSLRRGATNTVGLMLTSGSEVASNNDDFFPGVIDGMQAALLRHHLDLVELPCSSGEDPDAYLRRMVRRGIVDAVVVTATLRQDARLDYLAGAGLPFVALGRSESGGDHSWVDLDFEGAARVAVARLARLGHRRIALAAPASDINLGHLLVGSYHATIVARGLDTDPALTLRARPSAEGGYRAADALLALADRPSAIIVDYDVMALGIYRRLGEAGLRPGRDLAVIALRESPVARYLTPRLTCFRLSLRDLGVRLGETLLAALPATAEQYRAVTRQCVWPLELVEGESDPPAAA
jgi:DNA-binding LacI/PurR family transcriptional regulator